jgi:hypothetical protein
LPQQQYFEHYQGGVRPRAGTNGFVVSPQAGMRKLFNAFLVSNCKNYKYIFADTFAGSLAEKHGFQPTYVAFGGANSPRFSSVYFCK